MTEQTETNTVPAGDNVSPTIITLGLEAARRWRLSGEHGEAGDATAIVALYRACRYMTFRGEVARKKDDPSEAFEFDVPDMLTPYFNNDGSKDTRKMAARTAILAERLFGITTLTNAIKQRIARTVMSAVYLFNQFDKLDDDDDYNDRVTLRAGKLAVPYGVVAAPPPADASDNDRAFFRNMADTIVSLDGKKGLSLAELGKRANPPKAHRDSGGNNVDQGQTLASSIAFVSAIVQQNTGEGDECDVALSPALRRELFALSQRIADYFAVDPLEEEETEAPPVTIAA